MSHADAMKRLRGCRELQPDAMQVIVAAEIVDALLDPPGREDVPVGCVCNGGVIYLNGVMPAACPHCDGKGTLSRERYRELFGDAA